MLHPMQQAAQTHGTSGSRTPLPGWEAEPSPTSSTFAGLLAALAEPEEKPLPAWNDEGLADNVATLSYERALRAHARYRPAQPDPEPPVAAPAPSAQRKNPETRPAKDRSADANRSPKSASVTLRMSQAECTQLRERAAEAGLTVSAYLRSCAFEVESLRTQVKEALAQMRPPAVTHKVSEETTASAPIRTSWLRRLWNR